MEEKEKETMYQEILDHGYLDLIETWGSDERIIESARMSTNMGFKGWPADEKLLRYLYENKHSTPFEMAGLTIEVKAPIFVFRQWHRHRTQSYNEMSGRYTKLNTAFYVPSVDRLMQFSKKNKQAGKIKGAEELEEPTATAIQQSLVEVYDSLDLHYQSMLNAGVAKELARICLPVSKYSKMRASANLRNWLAFLTLRMDPHAQYEIRVYAEALGKIIEEHFPRTYALFLEGR